jgi:hypothetical protein
MDDEDLTRGRELRDVHEIVDRIVSMPQSAGNARRNSVILSLLVSFDYT